MNGFRIFFTMLVVGIAVGIWISAGPSACQPPDVGNCLWNADTNQYECPEEK